MDVHMKKSLFLLVMFVVIFGFFTTGRAALQDNGSGLIYDTVLDITWYDNTYHGPFNSGATHRQALNWAAELEVGGATGWTLPTVPQMLELYSTMLSLSPEAEAAASNSPFSDLQSVDYWSLAGSELGGVWWIVNFDNGKWLQASGSQRDIALAVAVHPGEIGTAVDPAENGASVPESSPVLLLGLGLLGLSGCLLGPVHVTHLFWARFSKKHGR